MTADLAFRWRSDRVGVVSILRRGRVVTTLRNQAALAFLGEMEGANAAVQQQLMARITGNYKRGNERQAKQHPRNRVADAR